MNRPPPGGDQPPDEHAGDLPFERLGHYRILSHIGGQGTADVYRGHDESLDRPVAIKVLPSHLADRSEVVRRFHAEAAATAKVVHPNVVAIHFVGQEDGHHFFAMQYVQGESLAQRMARSAPIELPEALDILEQCLLGLQAAHRQGLIHWGIKPANILLDSAGHAVLVDFGMAPQVERGEQSTAENTLLSTVDYLPPEQARQEQVDTRANIYSLGAVAFQALAGHLPFEADTPMAMVFQHAFEPPLSLEEVAPEIPGPIRDLVARMMAKDPADRYQSCGEVLADLGALRESESGVSRVTEASQEAERCAADAAGDVDLPADVSASGGVPAWLRLRNWALSCYYRRAPKFVKDVQDTTYQVDAALAQYNRQRNRLAKLQREAHSVIGQLSVQIRANLDAVADAEHAVDSAVGSDQEAAVQQRRDACAAQVEALRRHRQEQQRIVENLGQQLVEADSRLAQIRGRRDVLMARLSAAKARCVKEGRRLKPSLRPLALPLILAVVLVAAAPGLWQRFGPSPELALKEDRIRNAELLRAAEARRREQVSKANARNAEIAAAKKWADAESAKKLARSPPTTPVEMPSPVLAEPTVEVSKYHRTALTGHTGRVESVAYSPDGLLLASAGWDKTVRLWDVATGKLSQTLEGHADEVLAVAFSPDGSTLASMSKSHVGQNIRHRKRTIVLWDPADGKPRHTMQVSAEQLQREFAELTSSDSARPSDYGGDSYTLRFSPDGSVLASSGEAFSVRLWDTATGKLARSLEKYKIGVRRDRIGHRSEVCCVAFSGDGSNLLTSGWEKRVLWWDADAEYQPLTKRYLSVGSPGDSTIWSMAISPDGSTLAIAVGDHTAQLWRLSDLSRLRTLTHHTDRVRSVAFSPDGSLLAVASDDGTSTLWDVVGGQLRETLAGHAGPVRSVVFSPDGSSIASAGWDHTVRLWDLSLMEDPQPRPEIVMARPASSDPTPKSDLLDHEVARLEGHTGEVLDVRFTSEGKQIVSSAADRTVRLWDIATGRELRRFTGYAGPVWGVDVSPDGRLLVSGDGDGDLVFLDVNTGETIGRASGHVGAIRCVRFSQNGEHVASGGEDGSVRVWETDTAAETSIQVCKAPINAVSFAPTGYYVMATVSTEKAVDQWHIFESNDTSDGGFYNHSETVNCCTHFPENDVWGKAFSSSGNLDGSGKEFVIALWEARPGGERALRKYVGHTAAPWGLDCSSDGAFLVSGAADKTVRIWHVESAREMYRFQGHTAAVRPVALSEDDRLVASGSADHTVRVWRVPDPVEMLAANTSASSGRTPPGAVVLLTFEEDRIIRRGEQFLVEELSPAGNHFSGPGEAPSAEGKVGAGLDLREFQLQLPRTLIGDSSEYTVTAWVFVRGSGEPFVVYAEETQATDDSSGRPLRQIAVSSDGALVMRIADPENVGGPVVARTQAGSAPAGRWSFVAVRQGLNSEGHDELTMTVNQSTFFFPSLSATDVPGDRSRLGPGDGIIDEVTVFNRALTDKELRALYETGFGGLGLSEFCQGR